MVNNNKLQKVEQITIDWEVFKKALRRNYLEEDSTMFEHSHSFVLRLYPPFESEMEAEYHESEQGTHYMPDWNEKPHHINPETILLEGCDSNPFRYSEWPTRTNTKHNLPEDVIENNDIDELVEEAREIFWSDLKGKLPEKYTLGFLPESSSEVEINWVNLD